MSAIASSIVLNGPDLDANDEDKYVTMIALAEGSVDEAEFAAWLHQHIKLDAGTRVNEPRARYTRGEKGDRHERIDPGRSPVETVSA